MKTLLLVLSAVTICGSISSANDQTALKPFLQKVDEVPLTSTINYNLYGGGVLSSNIESERELMMAHFKRDACMGHLLLEFNYLVKSDESFRTLMQSLAVIYRSALNEGVMSVRTVLNIEQLLADGVTPSHKSSLQIQVVSDVDAEVWYYFDVPNYLCGTAEVSDITVAMYKSLEKWGYVKKAKGPLEKITEKIIGVSNRVY